jgi:hypothetical protein
MDIAVVSPGIKQLGLEAEQSPQSSAKVKNEWRFACSLSIRLRGMEWNKYNLHVSI